MNSRTPLRWVSSHPAFVAAAQFATNPPSAKTATPQQKKPDGLSRVGEVTPPTHGDPYAQLQVLQQAIVATDWSPVPVH